MHSNNVFQCRKIRTRKLNAKKSIKTVKNWNPALFGIRNPLCWNPESSTRNPESTAWNPESKNVLDSLTWGDQEPLCCEDTFLSPGHCSLIHCIQLNGCWMTSPPCQSRISCSRSLSCVPRFE